jgi:hypothetical protein
LSKLGHGYLSALLQIHPVDFESAELPSAQPGHEMAGFVERGTLDVRGIGEEGSMNKKLN